MSFFLFVSICSLFSLALALPVSPLRRDVWVPPIITPNVSTVWIAGCTYPVTWNTSSKPSQITNPGGEIYLRINESTQSSPIKQGFNLTDGTVNVTVPADTQPANDWIVVLMGDSGNWSPPITILPPSTCPS